MNKQTKIQTDANIQRNLKCQEQIEFPDRLNIWSKNKKNTKDNCRCFIRKIRIKLLETNKDLSDKDLGCIQ